MRFLLVRLPRALHALVLVLLRSLLTRHRFDNFPLRFHDHVFWQAGLTLVLLIFASKMFIQTTALTIGEKESARMIRPRSFLMLTSTILCQRRTWRMTTSRWIPTRTSRFATTMVGRYWAKLKQVIACPTYMPCHTILAIKFRTHGSNT